MKKHSVSNLIQIVIFLGFIGAFFIVNLLTPDKLFSENENRVLEQSPKFSFSALFEGKFTSKFETYITDQFVARDSWIALKSYIECALQKKENNGVYIGEGGRLLTRFDEPDENRLKTNIEAVNKLASKLGIPVYLSLIPTSTEIWADKLPANAPNADQKALIEEIYASSEALTVDIYSALEEHKGEYIYYHTDHHWTTLGAYYGYKALMEAMGMEPKSLASFSPTVVSTEFYGTAYSNSGVRYVPPDFITIYVEDYEGLRITNYSTGSAEKGVLYDYSFLDKKDKYSMFFGGNTPLLQIKTGSEGPKLLIIRDSYTDSQLPFLFSHFSEIHVIDLRYYKEDISEYAGQNGMDMVLINYGVGEFASDANAFRLGR